MKFTFYGHSCCMVEAAGKKMLFDPFITYNELAKEINIAEIMPDFIFVSHGHQDHISDCKTIALQSGAQVISSWEVSVWLNGQEVTNTRPTNTGGSFSFAEGFTVKCVVAHHSSSMPDGSYGGNPMGYLISTPEANFYFSGDTSLTMDMQLIPLWAKVDLCILPIGDNFTMGAEDAVRCADMVKSNKVIGVHYNTFGYIVIDINKIKEIFAAGNKTLLLPGIGETINV